MDLTAKELVESLGRKYGFDEDYCRLCCIKTIGEASFLLGDHKKLSDYAFIQAETFIEMARYLSAVKIKDLTYY